MPKPAYTFEVTLLSGLMDDAFLEENPVVSRTIRIGGEYTLNALHKAIFKAFDRFDEHMYEFQFGGKRPMDPKARCFRRRPPDDEAFFMDEKPPEDAITATIGSLGLKAGDRFFYWFDFGDDWHHEIKVKEIGTVMARETRPKVIACVGQSPPQYPNFEEDDGEA